MNRQRIHQLGDLIDRNSHYFRSARREKPPLEYADSGRVPFWDAAFDPPLEYANSGLVSFLDVAFNDPRFGWNFANSFVGSSWHIFDCGIYEIWIWRAYHHAAGLVCDEVIEAALAIDQSQSRIKANILRAVLVDFRLDWPEMAEIAQVEEAVLRAYEALFFNVRGRDEVYVNAIVYPEGILPELREDYITTEDIGNLMMRGALTHGVHVALDVARIRKPEETIDVAAAAREFTELVMARGALLASLGFLNRKCPAIDLALKLLLLEKQNQRRSRNEAGANGGGLARAVAIDVSRIKADDRRFHELVARCDARRAGQRSTLVP